MVRFLYLLMHSWIESCFPDIFPLSNKLPYEVCYLLSRIEKLCQKFDDEEKKTVCFPANAETKARFAYLLSEAEFCEKQLSRSKLSQKSILAINKVRQRKVALEYRIEKENGGLNPSAANPVFLQWLERYALSWKRRQSLMEESSSLSSSEIGRLEKACYFPFFIDLLFHDSSLRDRFFQWTIRDGIAPKAIIEFPAMWEKIVECQLNGRIGRMGGMGLQIHKTAHEKQLTLPFEGHSINILDGSKTITFCGNYTVTIAEIFDVFKNKGRSVGNFEYLARGIVNWNCYKWGYWDADHQRFRTVNLQQNGWWKELEVFEKLSFREARKRYGRELDGKRWAVAAAATRETATLNPMETHAFKEIVIPIRGKGYIVYPMGKYASEVPPSITVREGLPIMCKMLVATVSYPDNNVYYTHRQLARYAISMTASQGHQLMKAVKNDMVEGCNGNFHYQIESENCAKWVFSHLQTLLGDDLVPNLFFIRFLDVEPKGMSKTFFDFVKIFPKEWQDYVVTRMHILFGAHRGVWSIRGKNKEWLSLTKTHFWKNGHVYLPAFLHYLQDRGLLPRVLYRFRSQFCCFNHQFFPYLSEFIKRNPFIFREIWLKCQSPP